MEALKQVRTLESSGVELEESRSLCLTNCLPFDGVSPSVCFSPTSRVPLESTWREKRILKMLRHSCLIFFTVQCPVDVYQEGSNNLIIFHSIVQSTFGECQKRLSSRTFLPFLFLLSNVEGFDDEKMKKTKCVKWNRQSVEEITRMVCVRIAGKWTNFVNAHRQPAGNRQQTG